MPFEQDRRGVVGVVGAGTMGAGIAQLALENGHEVLLHDVDEAALERGRQRVADGLMKRVSRLDLDAESSEAWVTGRLSRLRDAHTLDAMGGEADIVIEAAFEDLELKRAIFRALDAATGPDVILATNTSALSVTAVAEATRWPSRVLGLHFFNPAPVMPLVEVVTPREADEAVIERASALMTAWGRTPVRCRDTPGFIVNRVNRPFTIEALRMLEAGEASVTSIDAAIRAGGFPMGPFELMDLVGIDVNLAAARNVWDGLGRPDRLRPSPIQDRLVEAGELGRKSGRGFYIYGGEPRAINPSVAAVPEAVLGAEQILERIRTAIDAEVALAVSDGVASASDVELALRLGGGHPERGAVPHAGPRSSHRIGA